MRLPAITKESWCRLAAMIGSPTSNHHHHYFCTCSLYLHPEPASVFAKKVPGLTSSTPIMLDQAQRARMAQKREQALFRLRCKQNVVNSTLSDTCRSPPYHGLAQHASLPGVVDFVYGEPTALGNQQDIGLMQHQCGLNASYTDTLEKQTDFQELEVIIGKTVPEKNEVHEVASSIREQEFDYVVVVDFEATCDKNMEKLKPQEIIEFPSVLVNCRELTLGDCFQTYVRPVHHPILTDFCTHLTGIQQQQVDKGIPLSEAIYWHDRWLEQNGIKEKRFAILIWSDWDCKVMLDSECKLKGLDKPHYFNRWINLKALFQGTFNGRKCNLRKAVEISGLTWMGRAHCGLDDAMNTARLAVELMKRGTILTVTGCLEPETLVTRIRRPELPGQSCPQASQGAMCDKSSVPSVQSSVGSVNGADHSINGSINVAMSSTILCYCGVICKRHTIKKLGPTHGKHFLACGRWTPSEGSRCGFFAWAVS